MRYGNVAFLPSCWVCGTLLCFLWGYCDKVPQAWYSEPRNLVSPRLGAQKSESKVSLD